MKMKPGLILAVAIAANCAVGYAQNTTSTTAPAAEATSTNAPSGNEVMPLIVIDEAPLTDAIRNLARQANLNIQFDPKVLANIGPDGRPQPMPNISFRWENVTPMQALRAVLDNNNLQMIQDPKTTIWRVTIKDPNAPEPLVPRVISLQYSHPTNLIPVVKASFDSPRSQVLADVRTSQLVVLATEKEHAKIDELIARLDTPPSQILIEARFIETTKNPRSLKGIDWTGTLEGQKLRVGNNFLSDETILPNTAGPATPARIGRIDPSDPTGRRVLPVVVNPPVGKLLDPAVLFSTSGGFQPSVGFLNADGISVVLSLLNDDAETETIATPRAVALEGVPTELSVVQNIPVFEEEQAPSVGGALPASTVKANYALDVRNTILNEVGTKLLVTPRVYGNNHVFLDLKPELSEVGPIAKTTLGGRVSEAPTFLRKRIQTQAMVPSGNTVVLGGLNEDRNVRARSKVPIFGDVPFIGRAFRFDGKTKNKRNLIIFITPTIMEDLDFVTSPESRDFLKQKAVDKAEPAPAWYDSVEPRSWEDWTKPLDQ